jgi:hypothetical protein
LLDWEFVALVGREKNDGRWAGLLLRPNLLRSLKTVHAGHLHIQQDDRTLVLLQEPQSFLARSSFKKVLAEVVEDAS